MGTSLNNSIDVGYRWFLSNDAASDEFLELLRMIYPEDSKQPPASSAAAFLLTCAELLNVLAKDPKVEINKDKSKGIKVKLESMTKKMSFEEVKQESNTHFLSH